MKNFFSPQKLVQLSLIFSSAVCFDCSLLMAEASALTQSDEKLRSLSWSNSPAAQIDKSKVHLRDDDSSLKWLNESSLTKAYGAKESAGNNDSFSAAGKMLFPIESTSPTHENHNSSASPKKEIHHDASGRINTSSNPNEPLAQNDLNTTAEPDQKALLINFNNISIIEYIRFISRNTSKNFIFDENDLQFNVTVISEEPATPENIMTALLQELRIHDLSLIEDGNNLIIHRNPKVNAISQLIDDVAVAHPNSEIITQVFRLNTANPTQVAAVIKPLTSEYALIEVLNGTNNLIITDLSSNVKQIAKLIKSLDSPVSGLVIGQYVVESSSPEILIDMVRQVIAPISQDQPLTMVPWNSSRSIFIVSTPFIVERTISLMRHIDQNERATKIFNLKDLQFNGEGAAPRLSSDEFSRLTPEEQARYQAEQLRLREEENERLLRESGRIGAPGAPGSFKGLGGPGSTGNWLRDNEGKLFFPLDSTKDLIIEGPGGAFPSGATGPFPAGSYPKGRWRLDKDGNWFFEPGDFPQEMEFSTGPKGQWVYSPTTGWKYILNRGETTGIQRIERQPQQFAPIPLAAKQKTFFSLYKLKYRKGNSIQAALQSIAASLGAAGPGFGFAGPGSGGPGFAGPGYGSENESLITTLTSVQWLEASNSLIFTGFEEDIVKVRELMRDIDVPLRQVFIEMLVLETSMADSLEYGVTWGARFGGGNWAGAESFSADPSALNAQLGNSGPSISPTGLGSSVANGLINRQGLDLGVIGQKIVNTCTGVEFSSIGALLHALRLKDNINIILSPKIITEDNVPAEIFVGENISFKTQSISNGSSGFNNSTITNNFEYRDIGTRLRVTPIIGSNDVISLEIAQERSDIIPSTIPSGLNANNEPGPSTTKSTTTTRVHLPDGYFLIISGMMRDQTERRTIQVPCLGAIPILGATFKDKIYTDTKRNQMIFLRPRIIDTEEEIQNLTKHEQDVWNFKKRRKQDWLYESEEAWDFLNLKRETIESNTEIADKDA